MPDKRLKRPRDPAQLAKLMIDIASGEVEDREPPKLVLRVLTPEEKRARLLALKDVERERKKRPPQSK
jgi:hypothetical protein